MIHLLDGGPTLEMDLDLQVEERLNLVDVPTIKAPLDHHSCHDITQRYAKELFPYCTKTSIFANEHASWTHPTHNKFAPY